MAFIDQPEDHPRFAHAGEPSVDESLASLDASGLEVCDGGAWLGSPNRAVVDLAPGARLRIAAGVVTERR